MTSTGGTLILPMPAGSPEDSIGDHTRLEHCLNAMLEPTHVFDVVVVAAAAAYVDSVRTLAPTGVTVVAVDGPATRSDCLNAVPLDTDFFVVHDVSRPLTTVGARDRVIESLRSGHDLVVPALVVTDSVKSVDKNGSVVATVDRGSLRALQFPRGFSSSTLRRILESGYDEIDFALRSNAPITFVDGDPDGFEIIAPRDTDLAAAIVGGRARRWRSG